MRFPGEEQDLEQAILIGKKWGYGNVIQALKDAWSIELQTTSGMSKDSADHGAFQICAWCNVDFRTGKKK